MDIVKWILDFIGVNNSYNSFSTHMYNFWSGFGGSISIFALIGAVIGIYRHNLQRLEKLKKLEQLNPLQEPIENIIRRVEHTGRDTPDDSNDKNSTKS